MSFLIILSALIVYCYFLFPQEAYAYLDPGSMSYVLQIVIAALIGGLLAIRMFWSRIKLFLTKLFSKKKDPENDR